MLSTFIFPQRYSNTNTAPLSSTGSVQIVGLDGEFKSGRTQHSETIFFQDVESIGERKE